MYMYLFPPVCVCARALYWFSSCPTNLSVVGYFFLCFGANSNSLQHPIQIEKKSG